MAISRTIHTNFLIILSRHKLVMRVAYYKGKRVHITSYDSSMKGHIFCSAGCSLIAKRGDIIAHHYAHKSKTQCSCGGKTGMWHLIWQDRAPSYCQEIMMNKNGMRRFADINVDNIVVEIQHSPMNKKEIISREEFYTETMGYNLVWVFDTNRWEYKIRSSSPGKIVMTKIRGSKFPLQARYRDKITLVLDFGKKSLLRVTSIKGSTITGEPLTMIEFDKRYLGKTLDGVDNRTFRPLL